MRLLYVSTGGVDAHLVKGLREAGHILEVCADLHDAELTAETGAFDGVILDSHAVDPGAIARMTPCDGGFLLTVTGSAAEGDAARSLRAGADAFFRRPFHVSEMSVRIEVFAREAGNQAKANRADGRGVALLPSERAVCVNGTRVPLPRREYLLLERLLRTPGEILTVELIAEHVWGGEADVGAAAVRTCVARLRSRIEPLLGARAIVSVRGHGYRWADPPSPKGK